MLDYQGVCNPEDKFGVKFSGGVGVHLSLQAWKAAEGKSSPFFTEDLWSKDDFYAFPNFCFPLTASPDSPISMISTGAPTVTITPTPGTPTTTTDYGPLPTLSKQCYSSSLVGCQWIYFPAPTESCPFFVQNVQVSCGGLPQSSTFQTITASVILPSLVSLISCSAFILNSDLKSLKRQSNNW